MEYEEYLTRCTGLLLDYISNSNMSEDEKSAIVAVFSNELSSNIWNTNNLHNYEDLIYGTSLKFIDDIVSNCLNNGGATFEEYEEAINCCKRGSDVIDLCRQKKLNIPKLRNKDLKKCTATLINKQDTVLVSSKIIDEDRKISELLDGIQRECSVNYCDSILDLLDKLSNDINRCKEKRLKIPDITNKNVKKISKNVLEYRKEAEKKESLYQQMYDIDNNIDNIISLTNASTLQWQEIINLCQKQDGLIFECSKKQWATPAIQYDNTGEIIKQYSHYIHMKELDNSIVSLKDSLSSNKKYNTFAEQCKQLSKCIDICVQNNWVIPQLIISSPKELLLKEQKEKNKRDRKKNIKRNLSLVALLLVAILGIYIFGVFKSRQGKVKIPFDAEYVYGEDFNTIYNELESAGFNNIQIKRENSGWLNDNEVISVSVDNQDSYKKKTYVEPNVKVEVICSSSGRKYVTDILENWKNNSYLNIENDLKEAGFSNITFNTVDTFSEDEDRKMASIALNNENYTNEQCYLPSNAPIEITYYVFKIGIGNDSNEFVGQNYEDVVANLEGCGFTNVNTELINTGWAKGNTVVSVTINNSDEYKSSATFEPDVRIVVKYSSDNRIDATKIMQNWNQKKYLNLQENLKSKGFTNILNSDIATPNKEYNNLVASITINNQNYISGDCYIQKNAQIVINYYVLNITIGQKTSYFTSNKEGNYLNVVSELNV